MPLNHIAAEALFIIVRPETPDILERTVSIDNEFLDSWDAIKDGLHESMINSIESDCLKLLTMLPF